MNPAISVIIPAYNEEKPLKRCLDSVFASDFIHAMEVILVNDGSTDGTLAVAGEYLKYPSFILIDQENQGTARARWSGIKAGAGEYFSFIDADDYIKPDMMSRMYSAIQESGADVAVCGILRVIDGEVQPLRNYAGLEPEDGESAIKRIILDNANFGLCNKLVSRTLITEEDCKRTFGIEFSEDLLLLFPMLLRARQVAYVADKFYFYVATPGSATQNPSLKSWDDRLFVHTTVYEELIRAGISFKGTTYHGMYVRTLLKSLRKLITEKPGPESQKHKSDIVNKLSSMNFHDVLALKSKRIIVEYFLVRLRLFSLMYSIWESRYLSDLRRLWARRKKF